MKKSELYHEAALCVLRDNELSDDFRLEIIAELLAKKNMEHFCEEQAEKSEVAV